MSKIDWRAKLGWDDVEIEELRHAGLAVLTKGYSGLVKVPLTGRQILPRNGKYLPRILHKILGNFLRLDRHPFRSSLEKPV